MYSVDNTHAHLCLEHSNHPHSAASHPANHPEPKYRAGHRVHHRELGEEIKSIASAVPAGIELHEWGGAVPAGGRGECLLRWNGHHCSTGAYHLRIDRHPAD